MYICAVNEQLARRRKLTGLEWLREDKEIKEVREIKELKEIKDYLP